MNARRCWFALSLSLLAALGCSSDPRAGVHDRLQSSPNEPPRNEPPLEEQPPNGDDDPGEQPEQDGGTNECEAGTIAGDGGELTGALPITVTGSVVGKHNDHVVGPAACRESETNASEDVAYTFTATTAGTYRFTSWVPSTEPVPTGIVMTIATPTCVPQELACQAYDVPAGIDVTLTAGQTVLIVIDPVFTSFTEYTLTIERK